MNNEQLAILVKSYVDNLRLIRNVIVKELDGIDVARMDNEKVRGKWIGKGEEPVFKFGSNPKDWEWSEIEGLPICVENLDDFIDSLEEMVEILKDEQ